MENLRVSARLTPAYAGNIDRPRIGRPVIGAHPRIRGEYAEMWREKARKRGSPPHTRGISEVICASPLYPGLTPAYAGNMTTTIVRSMLRQAHPRIRGEYLANACYVCMMQGSPPHTRGILVRVLIGAHLVGLTPAYAGNIYHS